MQAILAIQSKAVEHLQHFLGMVKYYHDLWARWSKILAPRTSLDIECSQTKVTKAKVPWHWVKVQQRSFDHVKATLAKEVVFSYLENSKVFEIYTDASSKQLGAVITQNNRPIVFFSRRLSVAQHNHSVTKIELLAIVKY